MGLAYIENLNGDVISYMDDPLNKTNYRNTNNTYNEDFNCGGWALNTFNWLCPFVTHASMCGLADLEDEADDCDDECDDDEVLAMNENRFFTDVNDYEKRLNNYLNECHEYGGDDGIFYGTQWDNTIVAMLSKMHLLAAFPDMREVNSFDELNDDEYGIAFATRDDDFHFIRYFDGVITGKCGGLGIHEYDSIEDGLDCLGYTQNKTYFARKIQEGMFNEW